MKKEFFKQNTSKYSQFIGDLMKDILGNFNQNDKDFNERFNKKLNGESVEPLEFTKFQKKSKSYFIQYEIFIPFTEIQISLNSLVNICVYMNFAIPLEFKNDIRESEYLRYHIENYFHELYILKTRLHDHLGRLRNLYRDPEFSNLRDELKSIQDTMDKVFKKLTNLRSKHVHEERFDESGLAQLQLLELLTNVKNEYSSEFISSQITLINPKVKIKWSDIIDKSVDKVIHNVDWYFLKLLNILIDPINPKDIIYPEDIK